MKRLKEVLDFLNTLVKAWPTLVSLLMVLFSFIIGLSNVGTVTIPLFIPLPLLVAAAAFMLYPVMKAIQWLISKPTKPFIYTGLLWKPAKLSFRYPTPLCPREGCGCEIICKADPSINIEHISGPFLQAHSSLRFSYECPIHGVIDEAPDLDIKEVKVKARMVQNRNRGAYIDPNAEK